MTQGNVQYEHLRTRRADVEVKSRSVAYLGFQNGGHHAILKFNMSVRWAWLLK